MDWKKLVSDVAPVIGAALGAPGWALLGIRAVAGALGLGENATEADVAKAMQSATPDQLLALKKADQDFAVKMGELGVDLERIAAGDRDSARNREIKVGGYAVPMLAAVVVLGFFFTLGAFITGQAVIPKEYELSVGQLIGALTAGLSLVLGYYFGTTAGSAHKTAVIDKMAAR